MLHIIGSLIRFSITISLVLLVYFVIREGFFYLRSKYYTRKYKNHYLLRNDLVWSMYKHHKLKYTLNDYQYTYCKKLDTSLKLFYDIINTKVINSEERNRLSKTIQKDLLNVKTLLDVKLLESKIKKINRNYRYVKRMEFTSRIYSDNIIEFKQKN